MRTLILCCLSLPLFLSAQPVKSKAVKPKAAKAVPATAAMWSLTGTITGVKDNSEVMVLSSDGANTIYITGKVVKGKFTLKSPLAGPAVYLLSFKDPEKIIPLFVDKGTMTIKGDINNTDALKVTGSALHDEFMEYTHLLEPFLNKGNELNQSAATKGVTDSLRQAFEANRTAMLTAADGFLKTKTSSPVSALMLLVITRYAPAGDYIAQRYGLLQGAAKDCFYGKLLAQQTMQSTPNAIDVGSIAPDFSQEDTNGSKVSLSSFKGKYVLIDFWASWCRPCREENPNVVNNYNKFKGKNFTVLGVSLDRSKEPWAHVSDLKFWNNAVAQLYSISSIPQNYLVGPDGKIVAKNLRGPELEAKLCQILGCN